MILPYQHPPMQQDQHHHREGQERLYAWTEVSPAVALQEHQGLAGCMELDSGDCVKHCAQSWMSCAS